MHYAVWQQHTEAVRLLLVRGADINAIDDCGYSALHLAAEHGYYDLTSMLLEMGAKVDYRQPTDESFPRTTLSDEPLRLALKNKHYVSIYRIGWLGTPRCKRNNTFVWGSVLFMRRPQMKCI